MEPLSNYGLYKRIQEFVNSSRQIISGTSELHVTKALARGLTQLIAFDFMSIYVLHSSTSMLYPMILEGSAEASAYQNLKLAVGSGIIGNAVKTGKPELVRNAHEDPRSVYPSHVSYDAEQLMVFPLMHVHQCWGVVAISRLSYNYFSFSEFEAADHLINYASMALSNITLTKQLNEARARNNFIQAIPDTIMRVRKNGGRINFYNSQGEETGKPFFFSEKDCGELFMLLNVAINSGEETSYEHIVSEETGNRYYETRLIPIYSIECISITRDITSLKEKQQMSEMASVSLVRGQKARNIRSFENARILLAEDNPVNQISGVKVLESWGLEVKLVANGVEVLNEIDKENFDLIIMDIQMPEMDGIEATRAIRNHVDKHKRNIPVLAMTASSYSNSVQYMYQAGANDHILKPFKPYELHAKIDTMLQNFASSRSSLTASGGLSR